MTLTDWFSANKGTAILVPGGGSGNNGQCEQAVDSFHHDVNGLPYIYTPNAKDFWYKFESLGLNQWYFQVTDGSIKIGDIVVYDPLSITDPQGHVDVGSRDGTTADFWAYDSNWNAANHHDAQGYPILYEVHHNDQFNSKILGSLRLKQGEEPMFDEARRSGYNYYWYGEDRGVGKGLVGQTVEAAMDALFKEGSDFDFQYKLNSGDVQNIKQATGLDASPWLKQNFKTLSYDFWMKQSFGDKQPTTLAPGDYRVN